jgi:bis(5'-nucleosyl)-tetraphosphatase (symmetrical)
VANYIVGDIQGCYDPLMRLLDQVKFDQNKDILYCVGDLVNRGPDSLKVLRFLKSIENQCVTVLGNHDIHLLSMVYGIRTPRPNDTLNKIIKSPDVAELTHWLRLKPLMLVNEQSKFVLCHAGIYPWWTIQEAQSYAQEVQNIFSEEKSCIKLLKKIYSNSPKRWSSDLKNSSRHRFIINAFTRMRFCGSSGNLNLTESGFAGRVRKNRIPWFHIPNASITDYRIVFGHWSALGLVNTPNYLCLDTGCVWGRHMTLAKVPKKPKFRELKTNKLFIAPNTQK